MNHELSTMNYDLLTMNHQSSTINFHRYFQVLYREFGCFYLIVLP
ncbi:hypothetical protein [Mucilaginibacter sp. NFX135]